MIGYRAPDLLRQSRTPRLLGLGVLVLSGLWSSYLVMQYRELRQRTVVARYEQSDLLQRQHVALRRINANASAESQQSIIKELNYPWPAVITALETPTGAKVQLLGIDPDTARAQLTVRGEAEELADVLEYLARLRQQKLLFDTRLDRHAVSDDTGRIEFVASANWRAP